MMRWECLGVMLDASQEDILIGGPTLGIGDVSGAGVVATGSIIFATLSFSRSTSDCQVVASEGVYFSGVLAEIDNTAA
ncbi:MAG: hypothetical protein U1E60_09535 [Reyranellaceae bacterium]